MLYSVLYHRLDIDKLDLETYYFAESGYLYYLESNKQTKYDGTIQSKVLLL